MSHDHTQDVLRTLKRIGLRDVSDPRYQGLAMHTAALRRNPDSFRAFVEEFPGNINSRDFNGCTPLHHAAYSKFPENVSLLLEFGVDPRPVNYKLKTPLDYAAMNRRAVNAVPLIDSKAYGDDDIDGFCEQWPEGATHIRSFYAALNARRAVNSVAVEDRGMLKPL